MYLFTRVFLCSIGFIEGIFNIYLCRTCLITQTLKMSTSDLYQIYLAHSDVQTDTRKLEKGSLFFALSGPNFNGNSFAHKAIEMGAAYCICDDRSIREHPQIIFVEDSLICLQKLAHHHRLEFDIPFIGITGSNGKTTTKELLHAVLSKKYKCYTTDGNLNNHIGVPLTLLKIKNDAEIAIVEMGANHLGEISSYCEYAEPNFGLINNCGKAHLEGFGSEENIRIGKGELYEAVIQRKGILFINEDLEYLVKMAQGYNDTVYYSPAAHKLASSNAEMLSFKIVEEQKEIVVKMQLVGEYNLPNAVAAVCIGKYFEVEETDIINALESYIPCNSRSQMLMHHSNKIVLDAYNANPSSMQLAIENFGKLNTEDKIVYLGSMKEMGMHSNKEHKALIANLEKYKWKEVILIGEEFQGLTKDFRYFKNTVEAQKFFQSQNYQNEHILIKGSRGLSLEKLLI